MKLRVLTAAAIVLASVLTPVAEAATKPKAVCNLIVDAKGDGAYGGSLDIVSADIATDTKKITAVIRVASFAETNSQAPTGQEWYMHFQIPGSSTESFLSYLSTPTDKSFGYGEVNAVTGVNNGLGEATGVADRAKNEIRITAPISSWAGAKAPAGAKITAITAEAYWFQGVSVPGVVSGGRLDASDDGAAKTSYTSGAKSCVVVGK